MLFEPTIRFQQTVTWAYDDETNSVTEATSGTKMCIIYNSNWANRGPDTIDGPFAVTTCTDDILSKSYVTCHQTADLKLVCTAPTGQCTLVQSEFFGPHYTCSQTEVGTYTQFYVASSGGLGYILYMGSGDYSGATAIDLNLQAV